MTELRSTLDDQQQIAVTIYNSNLALVKDLRRVTLPAGESLLALREVAAGMQPETALLRSLKNAAVLPGCGAEFRFRSADTRQVAGKIRRSYGAGGAGASPDRR